MKGECICQPENWTEHVVLSLVCCSSERCCVLSVPHEGFTRFRCELWWGQSWMCWWASTHTHTHTQKTFTFFHNVHTSQDGNSPTVPSHLSLAVSPIFLPLSLPTLMFLPLTHTNTLRHAHTLACTQAHTNAAGRFVTMPEEVFQALRYREKQH